MNDEAADEAAVAALDGYLRDLQAGRASSREQVARERPELAAALRCLEDLELLAAKDEDETPTLAQAPGAPASVGAGLPVLERYEVEAEIGRGGMGVVYKARQKDLDRPVALKMVISGHLATPEQLARFHDEARFAARLSHPNIVSIYETGDILGQPYFAMQYIGGPSLAAALRRGPMAPEEAARLLGVIAQAVEHLHQHRVIHRDLKPSNILLDEAGRPYVTDFGLVKMTADDSQRTSTGVIVGTPSYMAPEQASGKSENTTYRSDVYSLGAILYEMLTGRPPFQEASPLDTLVHVLESEPAPPRQLNPAIPAELELICLRCLEKDPAHRYASAAALAQDLDRFLQGETIEARAASMAQRLHRWARREPNLVAHLATLGGCTLIAQVSYQFVHAATVTLSFHLTIIGILVGWMAGSVICQALLNRSAWAETARFVWIWLDVAFFSVILYLDSDAPDRARALASPLLIGFPLLIVASGLWFRDSLVWFTTAMTLLAHAALLGMLWDKAEDVHKHVMFMVGLVVAGFVVAHQVRRVRALSRYYERRSL